MLSGEPAGSQLGAVPKVERVTDRVSLDFGSNEPAPIPVQREKAAAREVLDGQSGIAGLAGANGTDGLHGGDGANGIDGTDAALTPHTASLLATRGLIRGTWANTIFSWDADGTVMRAAGINCTGFPIPEGATVLGGYQADSTETVLVVRRLT